MPSQGPLGIYTHDVKITRTPSKRLAVATKGSCRRMSSQGPLGIYKLDMKITRNDRGNGIVMCEFGKLSRKASLSSRRVLMVVGATGAGKSTLINGMVNYLLGVSWDDDFRFKLISDEGALSQAQSQTKDITAYTFHKHKDSPLPYTLTVIDTPGFGDTEGLDKDKRIVKQVKELFSLRGPDGIDEIHGIGFVAQASEARLTHTQRYIFDSILSIFGKNMSGNMFMMITFADGQRPPVLDALKVAGIAGFDKSFYKFNNSALYASNKGAANGDDSVDDHVDKMFWKMGMNSFTTFFLQLGEREGGSLQHTKEVLREREHLEALVSGLQPKIRQGLSKMDEMRQEEAAVMKFEAEIEANKSFTYTQIQTQQRKVDLEPGEHVTVCMHCHYTCHYPCYIPKNADKMKCAAMKDGKCGVCIHKCDWNMHENTGYRLELHDVEVEVTSEQLKAKYNKAQSGKSTQQAMLDRMKAELQQMQSLVVDTIFQVKRSLARLNEIAMKSNPLSEVEYIELLIESEKSQGKPGFTRRIQSLEACKKEAELLAKIGQGNMHQPMDNRTWWKFWK